MNSSASSVVSHAQFPTLQHRTDGEGPSLNGWGKLSRAELSGLFGPFRSASLLGRTPLKLASSPSWDLFICAKDLFVEARAVGGPNRNKLSF